MITVLTNSDDFKALKEEIDKVNGSPIPHYGEPKEYPCRAMSNPFENEVTPKICLHSFEYIVEVECKHCETKTLVWRSWK